MARETVKGWRVDEERGRGSERIGDEGRGGGGAGGTGRD